MKATLFAMSICAFSGCAEIDSNPDCGDRCDSQSAGISVSLDHPVYYLNTESIENAELQVGGTFNAVLDLEFYRRNIGLCEEYGVDPLFWMAFSMEEYGGYRVGADPVNDPNRGLSQITVGREFVAQNGAAGIQLGDAYVNGHLNNVETELKQLGAPCGYFVAEDGTEICAFWREEGATQEQLDRQSFLMLSQMQEKVQADSERAYWWEGSRLRYRTLDVSEESSIQYGLQGLHGYGRLPYLYQGGYGADFRVQVSDSGIDPCGEFCDSGVRGSDDPMYGQALWWLMLQLEEYPEVRSLLPSIAGPIAVAAAWDLNHGIGYGWPR